MRRRLNMILLGTITIMFCILLLTYILYSIHIEIGKAGFCNDLINENHTIGGFYQRGVGYTVFTKGQTKAEINRTDCHEYCHFLIDTDIESYEHFCGVQNED